MNKLIRYITICALALVLTDLALGLVFDYLYSKTKTGQTGGKINHYLSLASPPDILIMGNSRSLYQIIPDSIGPDAYNLSHAGMGPSFQTGLLNILINQKKIPGTILLHLEPYDFFGNQPNRDIQNLRHYYGKDSIVTQLIDRISPTEKFKYVFQLYRYNGRIMSLLKNFIQTNNSVATDTGYEPLPAHPSDSLNTLYSVQARELVAAGVYNPKQLVLLNNFILMCRQQNISLICFSSPLYKSSGREFKSTLDSLTTYLAKMDVPYINYIEFPIASLENHPSLWRDANHLNHLGAQLESQALKKSVNKLLQKN